MLQRKHEAFERELTALGNKVAMLKECLANCQIILCSIVIHKFSYVVNELSIGVIISMSNRNDVARLLCRRTPMVTRHMLPYIWEVLFVWLCLHTSLHTSYVCTLPAPLQLP